MPKRDNTPTPAPAKPEIVNVRVIRLPPNPRFILVAPVDRTGPLGPMAIPPSLKGQSLRKIGKITQATPCTTDPTRWIWAGWPQLGYLQQK